MIERIIVVGKEIKLPQKIEDNIALEKFLEIIKDLDPDLYEEIKDYELEARIEGNALIVYRKSVIFG